MTQDIPPIKLAIILDDTVVDIIHADERFAAIWLSNPVVVDITPKAGEEVNIQIWDEYVDGQFTRPNKDVS
jgi:hypothetical protein